MIKVNKFITFFLVMVLLLSAGAWRVLQLPFFSKILSQKLTNIIETQIEGKIHFSGLSFKIYPLGVGLENVSFSINNIVETNIIAKRMDIDFSLIDLILNKMTVKRFSIETGTIRLKLKNSTKSKENLGFIEEIKKIEEENGENVLMVFNKMFNQLQDGRVKKIQLKDINFILDLATPLNLPQVHQKKVSQLMTYVKDLDLTMHKSFKGMKLSLESFKLGNINYINQFDFFVNLDFAKKSIGIKKFFLSKDFSFAFAEGALSLTNKSLLLTKGDLELHLKGNIKTLTNIINDQKKLPKIEQGYADTHLGLTLKDKSLFFSGRLSVLDLNSDYLIADNLETTFQGDLASGVKIKYLKVKSNDEDLLLADDVLEINWKNDLKILPAKIKFSKIRTRSILKFLNGALDPLNARLSGEAILYLDNDILTIDVLGKTNIESLDVDIKGLKVISLERGEIKKLKLDINTSNGLVLVDGIISHANTEILGKGEISGNYINLKIKDSRVDLGDFKEIVGMQLRGEGGLDVSVEGPTDNILFDFNIDFKNGSIFNLNLGDVVANFDFSLKKSLLSINSGKFKNNETSYEVDGQLSLEEESTDLKVKLNSGSYQDIKTIFSYYLKDISVLPKNVEGRFYGDFVVSGGTIFEELLIMGEIKSKTDIELLNEIFDDASFKVNLDNSNLKFYDFKLSKGSGVIDGFFKYDLKKELMDSKIFLSNLPLNKFQFHDSFGLGINGNVKGFLSVSKNLKDGFKLNSKVELIESHIGNIFLKNSLLNISTKEDVWSFKFRLADDILMMESVLDYREKFKGKKKSNLKASIQTDEIYRPLSIFSIHNLSDKSLKGGASVILNSDFDIANLNNLDLDLFIEDFFIVRKDFDFAINKSRNFGRIRNGKIEKWDISFVGNNNEFESLGEGKLNDDFYIANKINLDLGFLELLNARFFGVNGHIGGPLNWSYNQAGSMVTGNLKFKDVDFAYDGVPGTFESCFGNLSILNGKMNLKEVMGKFANGSFKGRGEVDLKIPYPSLNLKGEFKQSYFQLFNKSNVVYSGRVEIVGETKPYKLNGDIRILRGNIVDEFENISSSGNSSFSRVSAYLPYQKKKKLNEEWFLTNINISPIDNLFLKNSQVNMEFMGGLSIKGSLLDKTYNGHISLVPGTGRIYFKNNDFILSKGTITFEPHLNSNLTMIDFVGESKINDYLVTIKISGPTDGFTLELSSTPPLTKKNILSLLTLGYTEDVSKTLAAQDRQSLAQAGIGTIILDRLKLDENIEEMFGLNLILAPELMEEGDININKQEGSKLRSATKIGLKKRVNKKIDLSGNVTVGAQTRKQSMNLDYKLGKKTSLQGVYETTTGSGEQDKQNAVSAGADLKFKWTFK